MELETEVQKEITEMIDMHGADIMSLPGSDFRRIFWDQQVITSCFCLGMFMFVLVIGILMVII